MMRALFAGGVLLVLTVSAYLPAVTTAGFVYEDAGWHRTTQAVEGRPPIVTNRPLMRWSWWIQSAHGHRAPAFHVVSLVLHLVAGLLLGVLAVRLGLSREAAWLTSAVFLLHPLQVESVAYLSGRPELFAAIGVFTTCIVAAHPHAWRLSGVLAVVLCAGLAFAGKESAIVLLGLLPWLGWVQHRRQSPTGPFPYVQLGLAVLLVVVGVWWYGGPSTLANIGEEPGAHTTWSNWLLLQATAAHRLLGMTIWPVGQTVDFDYDAVPMLSRWLGVGVIAAVACVALACLLRARTRWFGFGVAWMVVVILPRLVIQSPRSYFNEHNWYMAIAGFAFAAGAAWDLFQERAPR